MSYNALRNSRVRNSSVCKFLSNNGLRVVWDERDNYRGFDEQYNFQLHGVWDGILYGVTGEPFDEVLGGDISPPFFGHAENRTAVDAGTHNYLRLKMRIDPGETDQIPTKG